MPAQALKGCQDISDMHIDMILGRGRKYVLPKGPQTLSALVMPDSGVRMDSQNPVQAWQAKHQGAWCVELNAIHSGVPGPLCNTPHGPL